ncbi:MAG: response regulator, partial [Desulfobacterales bacterium]|nr:response regulator [Desulfobacterales bacterium]
MKKKVLIVDDDPVMRMSLDSTLSEAGYETVHVGDGLEALEKVREIDPDVVLSDIVMPRLDGYELHKRLRQNSETADIPFLFLSVKSEPSDQLKGLQMGADDYVTKPFKIKDLIARMEKVMKSAERMRSFRSQAVFSGSLAQMDMGDVLQVVELNYKSGELVLRSARGKKIGSAFFQDGRLINAVKNQLTGLEAFYDLIAEGDAFFEFFGREVDAAEEITQSNMAVLLDGKLIIDEGRRLDKMLESLDVVLTSAGAPIPEKTRENVEEWRLDKIMAMVESRRTAREIVDAGVMSRHRAAGVLAELLDVGVVEVMTAQPAAAPAAPLPAAPAPLPDAPDMEKSLLKGLNNIDRRKLTGILEIRDRPVKSTIYFDNGRIVHAYHGMTTSKKALFRIFSEKGGL